LFIYDPLLDNNEAFYAGGVIRIDCLQAISKELLGSILAWLVVSRTIGN
jgi:hypothetical protein